MLLFMNHCNDFAPCGPSIGQYNYYSYLNVLFLEIYLSKHFCFDLNNLISRISGKSTFCNGPINFEIKRFNCTNMQFSEKYNIDYKQAFLLS